MESSAHSATTNQPEPGRLLASNVRPGDKLKADAGFGDDIADGAILTVGADKNKRGFNRLFVPCSHGRHYLAAQVGDHGELIGFSAAA